jgi:hypothetical protein
MSCCWFRAGTFSVLSPSALRAWRTKRPVASAIAGPAKLTPLPRRANPITTLTLKDLSVSLSPILQRLLDYGADIFEVRQEKHSLDDIFLALFEETKDE